MTANQIYTDALTRLRNVVDRGTFAVEYTVETGRWCVKIDYAGSKYAGLPYRDLDLAVDAAVDWVADGAGRQRSY